MKQGILFPGQGSQFVGMGKSWFDTFSRSREIFQMADSVLGFSLSEICFAGPEEKLQATDVAQPAIFVTSVAALEVLREQKLVSSEGLGVVAGLSLGEYTALYAAEAIDFEDALRLVRLRGELMQKASLARPSGMASVLGLTREDCEAACKQAASKGIIAVANLNSPGQVVLSGEIPALELAEDICKEKGARRVVRLQVAGAFHSEVMRPAAEGLEAKLAEITLRTPQVPFLSNVSAQETSDPIQIRSSLARQLCSPVLWESSMRQALQMGIREFIEPSPGTVLKGLMRKIDREAVVHSFNEPGDLPKPGA